MINLFLVMLFLSGFFLGLGVGMFTGGNRVMNFYENLDKIESKERIKEIIKKGLIPRENAPSLAHHLVSSPGTIHI